MRKGKPIERCMYCHELATVALVYLVYERYDYRRHIGGNRVARLHVCSECERSERFLKLQREKIAATVERIGETS